MVQSHYKLPTAKEMFLEDVRLIREAEWFLSTEPDLEDPNKLNPVARFGWKLWEYEIFYRVTCMPATGEFWVVRQIHFPFHPDRKDEMLFWEATPGQFDQFCNALMEVCQ